MSSEYLAQIPTNSPYGGLATPNQPSLVERLKFEKQNLESRLDEVNKALEALAKNPEFENLIHLITKVTFRL